LVLLTAPLACWSVIALFLLLCNRLPGKAGSVPTGRPILLGMDGT